MFNIRLAGGHLYGKQLFTWLSLVVSFMASFVLSFFPLDVLDGIWDLIESVSEGFLTYSFIVLRSLGANGSSLRTPSNKQVIDLQISSPYVVTGKGHKLRKIGNSGTRLCSFIPQTKNVVV